MIVIQININSDKSSLEDDFHQIHKSHKYDINNDKQYFTMALRL